MKIFSLFSGVSGLDRGIDGEVVGFSEIDKYASMVLRYHYPNIKNYGDITKIRTEELPDFDILTGGSPCQDLSIAGKRRGLAGARSGLFMEYIRILRAKKPRYFIWENVKGALSSNYGFDFAVVLNEFSESGYSLWWQVLNAKDFGVPQNRERIFVIGYREGSPKEIFFSKIEDKHTSDENEELREQVSNTLRTNYGGASSNETYIADFRNDEGLRPRKEFIANTLQAQAREDGTAGQPLIVALRGRNPDNPKSRKSGLPTEQMLEPNLNGVSNTLTSVEKDNYVFDGTIRRLTPIECERLMSYPDDWTRWGIDDKGNKIEISDSQRYKMCGNGVVTNVIKELAKSLL